MEKYSFLNDNIELYREMINDIDTASKYVYLETYIFDNESVGKRFRKILLKKAKQGVEVKILADGMGSTANKRFFSELVEAGGQARIFREFQWSFRMVKHNTSRNHRKLLVIDDQICYIGSSNIYTESLSWRESNLKITSQNLASLFKRVFLENFNLFDKHFFLSKNYVQSFKFGDFEIVRDVPSLKFRQTRKRTISMIRSARKQISVEAAYFLPDFGVRRELKEARERGVKVTIVVPKYSDHRIFDLLREKYLGKLHELGITVMLYNQEVLHSKFLLIDDEEFLLGSSNMDYRSYSLQFEVNIYGKKSQISQKIAEHFHHTLLDCEPFDYETWKKRSWGQKIIEKLLSTIRYSM